MAMGWGWRPAGPCWSLLCVCAEALSASWGGCPGASPHPQPGFTSPFWRQVEVWSISELGLGCCFLICCCKRREKKKKQPSGNVKQVAGAWRAERDRVEADVGAGVQGLGLPGPPEAHLCVAGGPKHRAPSWSPSLHVRHGDLSGGRCSGYVPRARTLTPEPRAIAWLTPHLSVLSRRFLRPSMSCPVCRPHVFSCRFLYFPELLGSPVSLLPLDSATSCAQGARNWPSPAKNSPDPGALQSMPSLPSVHLHPRRPRNN